MSFHDVFSLSLREAEVLKTAVAMATQRAGATEPAHLLAIEDAVLHAAYSGALRLDDINTIASGSIDHHLAGVGSRREF